MAKPKRAAQQQSQPKGSQAAKPTTTNVNVNVTEPDDLNAPANGDKPARHRMALRTSTKTPRPSQVHVPQQKRSSEEVKKENQRKKAAKEEKKAKLKASRSAVAAIERETIEHTQRQLLAPPKLGSSKVNLPRQVHTRTSAKNQQTQDDGDDGDDSDEDSDEEGNEAESEDSDESPPTQAGYAASEESESEGEGVDFTSQRIDAEMENDEDDTLINEQPRSTRKVKPGVVKRNAVRQIRNDEEETCSDGPPRKKRKKTDTKQNAKETGLKGNWKNEPRFLRPLKPAQSLPNLASPEPYPTSRQVQSQPTASHHAFAHSQPQSNGVQVRQSPSHSQPVQGVRKSIQFQPTYEQSQYTPIQPEYYPSSHGQHQPTSTHHPQLRNEAPLHHYEPQSLHVQSQVMPTNIPSSSQPATSRNMSQGTATASAAASNVHQEQDVFQPGGLVSENEEEETQPVFGDKVSLVKIADVRPIVARIRHSQKVVKRVRPTYGHIPPDIAHAFSTIKPIVFDMLAREIPWDPVPLGNVVQMWNARMGSVYPICPSGTKGPDSLEAFAKVKYLIQRNISSNYVHEFAVAAVKAVSDEWKKRKLVQVHEKQEFVEKMLGPKEDMLSLDRPFIWRSRDSTNRTDWKFDPAGDELRGGMFLGCLVARTLAVHIRQTSIEVPNFSPHPQPRGALMFAISAVHRALFYSTSGSFSPPQNPKQGDFSAMNWGDGTKEVDTPGGRREEVVRRATMFAPWIDVLTPPQWKKIMDEASKYVKPTPAVASSLPRIEMDEAALAVYRGQLVDHDCQPSV